MRGQLPDSDLSSVVHLAIVAPKRNQGFIKEDLSKRLKGPKIGLCEQQLAAIIISAS
jgi:hypothetical protein